MFAVLGAVNWLSTGSAFGAILFAMSAAAVLLFIISIARGGGDRLRKSVTENAETTQLLKQDEQVWSFARRYPSLLILTFMMDIAAVIVTCVLFFFFSDTIRTVPVFIAAAYGSLFIGFSIFVIGYLMVAEWMQRFILHRSGRSIFRDLFFDYVKSIPLVIVFSVIGILFLFSGKQRNAQANLQRGGLYALFITIKAYTYINLALLALHDTKGWLSYKEAKDMLTNDPVRFAKMWFINGVTLVPLGLLFIIFLQFSAAHPDNTTLLLLSTGALFLYMLFLISMEQLAFLLHFAQEPQDSASSALSI